jgi:hypothetical protein
LATNAAASLGRRGFWLRQHFAQSPVHDLDFAKRADHDVRRLEVAMDHSPRMRVGERLADLLEDGDEAAAIVAWIPPLCQQSGQRLSLDQLHREIRALILKLP